MTDQQKIIEAILIEFDRQMQNFYNDPTAPYNKRKSLLAKATIDIEELMVIAKPEENKKTVSLSIGTLVDKVVLINCADNKREEVEKIVCDILTKAIKDSGSAL